MKYLFLPTFALLVSIVFPFAQHHQIGATHEALLPSWGSESFSLISDANAQEQEQDQALEPDAEELNPKLNSEAQTGEMTFERMAELILQLDEQAKREGNLVEFTFAGRTIVLIAAPQANRMRLVSGITEAQSLTDDQILATLVSNYHLALDARYAIGNGVLFSVFVHPLAELDESQLLSGIRQVASLASTFGTTYSSGELSFGVGQQEERVDI